MATAVSLIMPVFNSEKYLAESIESVLSQTLINIELICVDDGSTDDSLKILKSYAASDFRVKIIQQENKGPGEARNAAIEVARGEYVAFIDSDDLYGSATYLEVLYRGAKDSKSSIAAAKLVFYYSKKNQRDPSWNPYYEGYSFDSDGPVAFRNFQFDYGFHRFLFCRNLFEGEKHRFSQLSYFEDPVWLVRILLQEGSFFAVSTERYLYRVGHKVVSWNTDKLLDLLEGVKQNLLFSRDERLAKLHWYTAHHLDELTRGAGVCFTKSVDLALVSKKLKELEAVLDHGCLVAASPADAEFVFDLRKQLESSSRVGSFKRSLLIVRHWLGSVVDAAYRFLMRYVLS